MDDQMTDNQNTTTNPVVSTTPNAAPNVADTKVNTMPDTSVAPDQEPAAGAQPEGLESMFVSSAQAAAAPTSPPTVPTPVVTDSSDQISFSKGPEPTPDSTSTPITPANVSGEMANTSPSPAMVAPIPTGESANPPTLEQTGAIGIYPNTTTETGRLEGAPMPENAKKPVSWVLWLLWIVFVAALVALFLYEPTGSKIMGFFSDILSSGSNR